MTKISQITGKPVITLYEAKEHGILNCALVDKRLRRVHYCTLTADDGLKYIMPAKDIYVVSDAVIVINDANIAPYESVCLDPFIDCPISCDVYSADGDFLGTLGDIEFSKSGAATALFVNDAVFSPSSVAKAGSIVIMQSDAKPSIRKRKSIPTHGSGSVEIIGGSGNLRAEAVVARDEYGFLLGRRVLKNIYNNKRQLIVKQGSTVDKNAINAARRWHKLPELTIYSK